MEISEGIALIEGSVPQITGTWGDIGAGTGFFTQVLDELLPAGSHLYAVDKNPHALYTLEHQWKNNFHIEEGDFDRKLSIPICDGLLIANTLHYSADPVSTLQNLFQHLRVGGKVVFVEYETEQANPPWIPYPLPYEKMKKIMQEFPFSPLEEMGRVESNYGHNYIYSACAERM